MTRRQVLTGALVMSGAAFAIGAGVYTGDWLSCMQNKGGNACRESRNMAASAWAALGVNALALATNILDNEP